MRFRRDSRHEKGYRNHEKEPVRNEEYISEMKNTLEGIKSSLDGAEDLTSDLEDKVENRSKKKK